MTGRRILLLAAGVVGLAWLCCLPRDLFRGLPYSTVVTDRSGVLLGARTADDGQWRFPPRKQVPSRYATALIQFEDRHFRWHPGVDPLAIGRAIKDNLRSGHVTSGGSTLSMQVIRLSRQRERTLWQKAIEAVLATRLECRYSKKRILALYASHAPFGGNVVGLDAAAWRYFGVPPEDLSWAEAATLAVLPNAPASIHPGKGREALLAKRNRLLKRLLDHGDIDEQTYQDACLEPLPDAPQPLPSLAFHLVERAHRTQRGQAVCTSLDAGLQTQVEEVAGRWSDRLAAQGVADLAAVVIDLHSGLPVAYVGNASPWRSRPGREVDIAAKPRSTGSILKPFLFCAAWQEGLLLSGTLIPDIPLNINGFAPQNFDMKYSGAVPAGEALQRSLNVPSVFLLRDYGVPKFQALLQECGLTTLTAAPEHYGLSLILGGAEGTLEEITRAYAGLARSYEGRETFPLHDRVALWETFEALKEVNRPEELDIHLLPSLRLAAWKTGTSYGFRDAWAVGLTPDYAVGVWAGNADGHGVSALTGARTAGPVLFDLINLLPRGKDWFDAPDGAGVSARICPLSGHLAGPHCPESVSRPIPAAATHSPVCPYHRLSGGKTVFKLPPAMEWYYRERHPEYQTVMLDDTPVMEFIHPSEGSVLRLPRQLDGSAGSSVFQLAHSERNATVYWHMDGHYLGKTTFLHQLVLSPEPGKHELTAVDQQARTVSVHFSVAPLLHVQE